MKSANFRSSTAPIYLCMTAAYFDISLLHIIYPILIGRGRSERGREGRRRFGKLCHAAMFAQTEKCGALCGRRRTGRQNGGARRRRGRRGERCHYVKFGITTGFPAQIGVTRRRSQYQKGVVRAGHSLGLGSTQCPVPPTVTIFPTQRCTLKMDSMGQNHRI